VSAFREGIVMATIAVLYRKGWVIGFGTLLLVSVMVWIRLPHWRPHVLHGFAMQPPKPAADFTLTAHTGERVSLHDFRGKLVLLYFGYMFCPGICPTTLTNVAQVLHQFGAMANRVQLLMISVDPERDTPDRLAAYITHFHPSFIGLTGSVADVAAVAPLFGIYYEKQENTDATHYWVDHSATLMVIDGQSIMRLIIPFGTTVQDMAADLAALLREGAPK
jgi:protein SCO1/2